MKTAKIAATFATLMLATGAIAAVRINLPSRYTETSYTINTVTGVTWNEKSRDKTYKRPLLLSKQVLDGKTVILMTATPRPGIDIDKTDPTCGKVPYERRDELIGLLKKCAAVLNNYTGIGAKMKAVDKSEQVFTSDDIDLSITLEASPRRAYVDMKVGDAQFVMKEANDINTLVKTLQGL